MSLLPFPKSFNDRLSTSLSTSPFPRQAVQLACNATSNFSLFRLADKGWKQAHLNEWFTPSHTAMIPSQWAQQILAQNLLVAGTRHLETGLTKSNPLHPDMHSDSNALHVAGLHPRHTHPTLPLLAIRTFLPCHNGATCRCAGLFDKWAVPTFTAAPQHACTHAHMHDEGGP